MKSSLDFGFERFNFLNVAVLWTITGTQEEQEFSRTLMNDAQEHFKL